MTRFCVIVRRTISDDTKIAFVPNLKAAFIAITSFQILLTLRVSFHAPNSKRRDRLFAPPRRVGISKRFWRTPRYRQTDSHSPIPQYLPFTLRYGVFAVRLRSGHCHLSDNRFRGRSRLRSAFDGLQCPQAVMASETMPQSRRLLTEYSLVKVRVRAAVAAGQEGLEHGVSLAFEKSLYIFKRWEGGVR